MHQVSIKSVFSEIAEKVFQFKNLGEAKTYITEFLTERRINEKDKKLILHNVAETKTIVRLQSYICSSLLKYEGLSLSSPKR